METLPTGSCYAHWMAGFEIHHIGETLVASILRELHAADKLAPIPLHRLAADLSCATDEPSFEVDGTFGQGLAEIMAGEPKFTPEWHLFDDTLTFDAESRIDVLLHGKNAAMPWEVKLGLSGLGRGTLLRRFCAGTLPNNKSKNRVAGNMISILQDWCSARGEMAKTSELFASERYQSGPRVALERRWGLVLRRSVFEGLRNKGPSSSKKKDEYGVLYAGVHIMVFEDLIEALTEMRLWNLVRELFEESLAGWKTSLGSQATT